MLHTNELIGVVGFAIIFLFVVVIFNKPIDKDQETFENKLKKLRYPPQ